MKRSRLLGSRGHVLNNQASCLSKKIKKKKSRDMTDIVNKVNGREFSLMKVEELPCLILSLY